MIKFSRHTLIITLILLLVMFIPITIVSASAPGQESTKPFIRVTPELLVSGLNAIVSVVLARFPKLRVKYTALSSDAKSGIAVFGMVLIAALVVLLQCYMVITTNITCSQDGIVSFIWLFFVGMFSSQATYIAVPEAEDVKLAKAVRDQENAK